MRAVDWSALIPVNVVTGFLGSGKTTLLRRLLASPRLASTAVLVNEFGEVGLDHHLLEPVSGSMVLLDNGCVCCAVRDDLRSALLELHGRRERSEVPRYDRVVIESSGLADPAPVVHTLTADPVLRHHYRPGAVVTVVDAVHGSTQLDRYPESVKQVALADRMVLTKTDLAEPEESAFLRERLQAMNPAAPIRLAADPARAGPGTSADAGADAAGGGAAGGGASDGGAGDCGAGDGSEFTADALALLVEDVHRPDSRQAEAERWLGPAPGREAGPPAAHRPDTAIGRPEAIAGSEAGRQSVDSGAGGSLGPEAKEAAAAPAPGRAGVSPASGGGRLGPGEKGAAESHHHTGDVTSFCLETDEPIDWTVFGIWLGMLLHRHGENILRVKGIVDVPGLEGPVLLNAVQHTVHPPAHLPAWPRTWTWEDGGASGGPGGAPGRGTRIVFIVRGLDRDRIEHSLAAFRDALTAPPPTPGPEASVKARACHERRATGGGPASIPFRRGLPEPNGPRSPS